jgi:hypothetical protein
MIVLSKEEFLITKEILPFGVVVAVVGVLLSILFIGGLQDTNKIIVIKAIDIILNIVFI